MAHEIGETQQIRNLLSNKDYNQLSLKGQIEYLGKRFSDFKDISPGQFQLLRNKVFTSPIEDVSGDVAGLASIPSMAKDIAVEGLPLAKAGIQALGESKGAGVAADVGKTIGSKILPKTRAKFGEFRAARAAAKTAGKGPQAIPERGGLTMPKFGGRAEEELKAFGKKARSGRNRAMEPEPKAPKAGGIDEAEEALGAPGKPAAKATERPEGKPASEPALSEHESKLIESIRKASAEKDAKVAKLLKSKGINKQAWSKLSTEEKNKLIKEAAPTHRAYSAEKAGFRFNQIGDLLD